MCRSSFFLTGFYTLALVCLSLILKFGVLVAIHPPNQTLRGLFVLACGVAGIAGGGVTIFFWQQAKYFIGAWGGFSIGLWVQCFSNGGLIRPIGFRWILYIGACSVSLIKDWVVPGLLTSYLRVRSRRLRTLYNSQIALPRFNHWHGHHRCFGIYTWRGLLHNRRPEGGESWLNTIVYY